MIPVYNISTNPFSLQVWDVNGFTNSVIIAPGARCEVPGATVDGVDYYGGVKFTGTILVHDTAGGPVASALYSEPDILLFFYGGALSLTLFGVVFLAKLVKRGLSVGKLGYD